MSLRWKDSLILPLAATCFSGGMLLIQAAIWFKSARDPSEESLAKSTEEDARPQDLRSKLKLFARSQGGPTILAFKVTRLLGCLTLFALSVVTLFAGQEAHRNGRLESVLDLSNIQEVAMAVTYWYTAFVAAASLIRSKWSRTLTRHCNLVLLIAFGVYLYRDIWPLATYTKTSVDISDGYLLWTKLSVLTFTAVIVPLFIPRQYIPVDPKNPMEVLNMEQTASLFSLMTYSFLDPVISEAYRVPHLPYDRLPPLADYDYSKNLTDRAFPHLDEFHGAKRRHLFFGLMRVFFWEYLGMVTTIALHAAFQFASPLAINRILTSLESNGRDDYIRPWFWVVCLFFGPFLVSAFFQAYIYFGTLALARTQAILTQLVFEHAFRIRFKAEATSSTSATTARAGSPDNRSIADSSTQEGEAQSVQTETTGTSLKGKGKADPSQAVAALPEADSQKKDNLIGKMNTLVAVDLDNIIGAKDFLMVVVQVPLELILAMIFLYEVLGWSAIVGFASIVLMAPVPGLLAKRIQTIQGKKLEKTDARVESVMETIGVLRMIKLFGWEKKMSDTLKEKREDELSWVWKDKMTNLTNDVINFFIPTITMIVTYATYTLIMKQSLNASKVFSSMAVFDIIRGLMHRTSWMVVTSLKGKVSLERIGQFLTQTELLDDFVRKTEPGVSTIVHDDHVIGFNDAVFSWSNDVEDGTETPNARAFHLRIEGNLAFKKGCVNLIVGPTGSGKTSILMALLGEMHFVPTSVHSWYNLPRTGGIAYAAQESWVQNETIRDNILFGSPYDEERYQTVIYQCALRRDIELFEAGDMTEVGEKGLTLRQVVDVSTYAGYSLKFKASGGQKARVTLARAVYSSAEIILLDDVLAALDVHTSKWIVENCLKGDLLRGRTVILVTHNVALTSPIADNIISVRIDGYVHEVGTDISAALEDPLLAQQVEQEIDQAQVEEEVVDIVKKEDTSKVDGKLILSEEIVEGRVTWRSVMLFLKGLGGDRPYFFMFTWMLGITLMHSGSMLAVWFLGYWGSQYEIHNPEDVKVPYYLSLYCSILAAAIATYAVVNTAYIYGTMRASRTINAQLIDSVLSSTLRWLDETPAARIITRCTQDIATVDGGLPMDFGATVELFLCMIVRLTGPVIFTPIFLLPGLVIALLGIYLGNLYLRAQMSVKREMSNARSPVLSHFGGAIAGMVSIRAYGAQKSFKKESLRRIDHYLRIARTSYNLNRWIGIRMDLLGALFTTALASYLLIRKTLNAANIGFSLNMSLEFCAMILYVVRCYNDFEVQSNSLERIQSYLDIEHEPKSTSAGKPPAAWPKSGELKVESLSARYSETGPKVLHDLSFEIKSGERIGIVGRTGSGKSTLTLSLLRCIFTEGSVYYDNLPTNKINLEDLRSSVTIIPQMPELLSGTLRRNLDPFDQHDDAALNSALRAAGLFTLQAEMDEARLTLDSGIASSGNNLSVGQRQIIALARAIVRNCKLLILDEGTFLHHKTDSIIQSSLRNELGSDVTILIVAHRLQTIMDADKIMVLDDGKIAEYDTPQALLQKKGGYFSSLVDESGDKKALYAMSERKASGSTERTGEAR
ncbi:multidrug resistance-associated ABC transporter [Gymnopilus junonius]|uniref:Multidrug resistance-associated ABC transporter n=1 Tax=Gymnopilus junonius TaxID=109634 RepID=A0A9P5TK30_GYMJU|nr:multidrug resistance-associated ABC transporter [Gymnopilus junonius]